MARVYARDSKKGLQIWWEVKLDSGSRRWIPTGAFLSTKKREQQEQLQYELALCTKYENLVNEHSELSLCSDSLVVPSVPVVAPSKKTEKSMLAIVEEMMKNDSKKDSMSALNRVHQFISRTSPMASVREFADKYSEWFVKELTQYLRLSSVKQYVSTLNAMFGELVDDRKMEVNPFSFSKSKLAKLTGGVEMESDLDIFTKEQLLALCNSENALISLLTRITFLCYGRRVNEVAKLKWSDIDFEQRTISFKTSKTGKICKVYIGDMLMGILDGLDKNTETVLPRRNYSAMFSDYLLEAGMVEKPDKRFERRPLSHHAIRRTVETILTDEIGHDRAEMLVGHVGRTTGMRHYYKAKIDLYVQATKILEDYIS